jgi:hypothetical protein
MYNPDLKSKYDKQRYAKQKEEYLKNNPDYIPVRLQQKLKREELLKSINKPQKIEVNNIS